MSTPQRALPLVALVLACLAACGTREQTARSAPMPAAELLRTHSIKPHLDAEGRLEGFWDSNRDREPLPDAVWAALRAEPSLRWLGMARAGAADLRAIGTLTSLRSLNLGGGSDLGGDHLAPLAALEQLEQLNIHHLRGWSGAELALLGELPRLRDLTIHNCRPFDRGLALIAEMHALEVLHFTAVPVRAADCAALAGLPRLRELTVVAEPGPAAWRALAELPALRDLHILYRETTPLPAEALDAIRSMQLEGLRAINLQPSASQVAALRAHDDELTLLLKRKADPHAEAEPMPLADN